MLFQAITVICFSIDFAVASKEPNDLCAIIIPTTLNSLDTDL